MTAGQVAVALLKAEDVAVNFAGGFQQGDLFADELEARQNPAQLHAVVGGDSVRHIGGNNGGDCHGILGHSAVFQPLPADVIEKQNAHFVAGDQPVVVPLGNGNAHAVAVRVGAKQQIGLHLPAQGEAFFHSLPDFGIGIGAGGEVSVGMLLLGNHGDIRDADTGQNFLYALQTRAIQGRINHLQIQFLPAGQTALLDGIQKALQTVFTDGDDLSGGPAFLLGDKIHSIEHAQRVDFFQNSRGHVQGDLAAVGAIDLVAVIFGGVVAGGDADACAAA